MSTTSADASGPGVIPRGRRPRDPLIGGWRRWLLAVPIAVVTIPLLIVPLAGIVRAAFDRQTFGARSEGVWTLDNWIRFVTDPFFWQALGMTLLVGMLTAVICFLLGFPYAFLVSRRVAWRELQLGLLIAPLLVNMVARVYGWQVLLADSGPLNQALLAIGVINDPIRMQFGFGAIIVALVHVLLPYMVLAIYAVLGTIDRSYEDAARSLGAPRWRVFRDVTLPLAVPGIVSGFILVFTSAAGSFLVPSVMGGGRFYTLPTLIYQYSQTLDYPLASVIALVLVLVTTPAIVAIQRRSLRTLGTGR